MPSSTLKMPIGNNTTCSKVESLKCAQVKPKVNVRQVYMFFMDVFLRFCVSLQIY